MFQVSARLKLDLCLTDVSFAVCCYIADRYVCSCKSSSVAGVNMYMCAVTMPGRPVLSGVLHVPLV
jgi:hypothetical protein